MYIELLNLFRLLHGVKPKWDNGKCQKVITLAERARQAGRNRLAFSLDERQMRVLWQAKRSIMQGVDPETAYDKAIDSLIFNAIKDLSVIKNPIAKETLKTMREEFAIKGDVFLWASKIFQTKGGDSAVITLHVSGTVESLMRRLTGRNHVSGNLLEGVRIECA